MENIQFDTEARRDIGRTQPTLIKFLFKLGVKSETTANMILLGISAVAIAVTAYLYMGIFKSNTPVPLTPEETQAFRRGVVPAHQ